MRSIIERYLVSGKPTEKEAARLQEKLAEIEAREAAIASLDTSHAFIRIRRFSTDEPITIFGSPTPSRVLNRIEVATSPNETPLFTALITDTALARMTMSMNSSANSEMLLESVLGKKIDMSGVRSPDPARDMKHHLSEVVGPQKHARSADLVKRLADLKKPLGKAEAEDIGRGLSLGYHHNEVDFYQKVHREASTEMSAIVRSEAAALVKSANLLGSPETLKRDEVYSVKEVPEASVLLPDDDPAFYRLMTRAYAHEMRRLAEEIGVEDYDLSHDHKGEKLVSAVGYSDPRRKEIKSVAEAMAYSAKRGAGARVDLEGGEFVQDPRHLIGKMGQQSGRSEIHSDSPASNSVISFTINAGEEVVRFGKRQVSERSRTFFEILITDLDLMSCLRADPDGETWTRCSLRAAFGGGRAIDPYVHPLSPKNKDFVYAPPEETKDYEQGMTRLAQLIQSTGLKRADDRREAAALAASLHEGLGDLNRASEARIEDAMRRLEDKVSTDLSDDLGRMLRGKTAQAALRDHGNDFARALLGHADADDEPNGP